MYNHMGAFQMSWGAGGSDGFTARSPQIPNPNETHPNHIYLAPHLDDATLSCGGRIWQQTRAGERVLVVTVFAGSMAPDAPLSPFAREMHADWALAHDATAQRRREDAAAMTILGAEAVHWGYLDCIYRRTPDGAFPYDSLAALFGKAHPAEGDLTAALSERFSELVLASSGMCYAPMGVGNHVDHQIVHRAAEQMERAVCFYEDYPYAEEAEAVERALSDGAWREERMPISEEALEARIAASACYASQLEALGWDDAQDMATSMRAFARRVGQGQPAERCWRRA